MPLRTLRAGRRGGARGLLGMRFDRGARHGRRDLRRVRGGGRPRTQRGGIAMPRPLWKGAISFGLVNIPVELYPAENRKSFEFSMLDKRDLSPVGYKRYSKTS